MPRQWSPIFQGSIGDFVFGLAYREGAGGNGPAGLYLWIGLATVLEACMLLIVITPSWVWWLSFVAVIGLFGMYGDSQSGR
jgi:hypothetical protein